MVASCELLLNQTISPRTRIPQQSFLQHQSMLISKRPSLALLFTLISNMPFPESINGSKGDKTGQSAVYQLSDKEVMDIELLHTVRRMMMVKSSNNNTPNTGPPWTRDEMAGIAKARFKDHQDLNGDDITRIWNEICSPSNMRWSLQEMECGKYLNSLEKDLERYKSGWRAGMPEPKGWP